MVSAFKPGPVPLFVCLLLGHWSPAIATAGEPAWRALLAHLPNAEHAGYGGLCGLCVDHATGDVIINLSDRGFYRSTDRGKSFQRISNDQPRGRTEEPGCFLLDPTGKTRRLLTALVYGSPLSTSADGGISWKSMEQKSAHIDWGAMDWTGTEPKFVLALKHESGGQLIVSRDGGKSFVEVGKNFGTGWIFDERTAVVARAQDRDGSRAGLQRTADAGRTWAPCSPYRPVGRNSAQASPRWHEGKLYWLVEGALIATADRAATWKKVCTLRDGRFGPVFGKDSKHLFILTGAGIIESNDGGAVWSSPIAAPTELKGVGGLTWLDYDPGSDTLYIMKMGSDLFKLKRTETFPKK